MKKRNYAFIDSQNLNLGVSKDVTNLKGRIIYKGRKLNYHKFRDYLTQKYNVKEAFIFIGLVPTNNKLYTYLQEAGFILVFKQVAWYLDEDGNTIVKGNVDTDITLHAAARVVDEYDEAIFISGDGDFLSTYEYIDSIGKLGLIMAPNRHRYSKLLNIYRSKNKLRFVSDIQPIFNNTISKKKIGENKKTRSGGRSKSLDLPGHGDKKNIAKKTKKVNILKRKRGKK
jgi:uncharacterized LabA/DUF88 family protein